MKTRQLIYSRNLINMCIWRYFWYWYYSFWKLFRWVLLITQFGNKRNVADGFWAEQLSPFTEFISDLLSRLPYSVYDISSSSKLIECAII